MSSDQGRGRSIARLTAAALLALLCLSSCGGGLEGLKGKDRVFLEPEFWARAEAMFGEEGGGYWFKEKATQIRYEGGHWFVRESHHYQIVVLDAGRLEEHADISIPYGPTSRLVDVEARTITSTGEVLPVSGGNMHDKSRMPGFMVYSDRKAKVFPMPGYTDRCILDIAFAREDEALYFMDEFEFGDELPVRRAQYTYSWDARIYKAGFRIYYRSYNVDAKPVDTAYETAFGKQIEFRWEVENIDACPHERWMPPRERFIPRVALAGFPPDSKPDDWSIFTASYAQMLPKFEDAREEIGPYTGRITGEGEGEAEVMQALLDYFGENIRYVSVEIGESGWKPHKPAEVLENKYGDCKDMACLAVAALRNRGIEAYPALVRTMDNGPIDPMLVIPLFNHMIVYVASEGGDIWLDPTAAPCPVGYIPSVERDIEALVIQEDKAVWKHTPAASLYGSKRVTHTAVSLSPAGLLTGEFRTTHSGDIGIEWKKSYLDKGPKEIAQAVERDAAACFDDVSLDTCSLGAVDPVEPVVTMTGRFTKLSAAVKLEDRMVLRLDFLRPIMAGMADLPRGSQRKYPLWIPFALDEIDTLRIALPSGWEVETLPVNQSSSDVYGSYGFSCLREGDGVAIVITHHLAPGEYQGNRYTDFIGFWSEARARLQQDLVLRKI